MSPFAVPTDRKPIAVGWVPNISGEATDSDYLTRKIDGQSTVLDDLT